MSQGECAAGSNFEQATHGRTSRYSATRAAVRLRAIHRHPKLRPRSARVADLKRSAKKMLFPVFFASRQPLPKPFVETLCIATFLGLAAQTIYAYRKGVIYFGHPDGSFGPGSLGKPYNRISRDVDPKKFWRAFYLSIFLSVLFLAASICIHIFYPPNP